MYSRECFKKEGVVDCVKWGEIKIRTEKFPLALAIWKSLVTSAKAILLKQ